MNGVFFRIFFLSYAFLNDQYACIIKTRMQIAMPGCVLPLKGLRRRGGGGLGPQCEWQEMEQKFELGGEALWHSGLSRPWRRLHPLSKCQGLSPQPSFPVMQRAPEPLLPLGETWMESGPWLLPEASLTVVAIWAVD